jgi:rubrerythrin
MANQFASFLAATAQVPQPFFKNDLEIANYALTLEHLENAFYKQVNGSGRLSGKAATYLQVVGRHEQEHVDFLTTFIRQAGGTPVAAARGYDFAKLGDLNSQAGILKVAEMLEQTGVLAYDGVAFEIKDKQILAAAGSIVAVEARHTAAIRTLLTAQQSPTNAGAATPSGNVDMPVPNAFEKVLRPQEVLAAVGPIIQQ